MSLGRDDQEVSSDGFDSILETIELQSEIAAGDASTALTSTPALAGMRAAQPTERIQSVQSWASKDRPPGVPPRGLSQFHSFCNQQLTAHGPRRVDLDHGPR